MSSVSHPLPWPQVDEPLRHGYTVTGVSQLALAAVRRLRWVQSFDFDECLSAAHYAMIEHLYTCEQAPDETDLITVAMRGARRQRQRELSQHGLRDGATTPGRRFAIYWHTVAAPAAPADEDAADKTAFWQVWDALDPGCRDTFAARAQAASPAQAAQRLGVPGKVFHNRIRRARQQFLRLWHDGEAPTRPWRHDRPAGHSRRAFYRSRAATPPATPPARGPIKDIGMSGAQLAQRHMDGESISSLAAVTGLAKSTISLRLAKAGHVPFSANTRLGPAPKDLGISDEELLRRYRAGQSQASLARQYGVDSATIHARLRKAGHIPRTATK
jgi:DNA-directed RNA polymerase specialized sigma24 family protein